MGKESATWKEVFLMAIISFCITFFSFLIYEVIWGDILKDFLVDMTETHPYSIINLILFIGLFIALGINIIVNLFIFRGYTLASRLVANLLAIIVTIVILFFISFILIFFIFPTLTYFQILGLFPIYFVYFSLYILPSPVWFWIITIIIYHLALLFLAKMFYIKKTVKSYSQKRHKKQSIYKSKVI